jgi:hypothetical protein
MWGAKLPPAGIVRWTPARKEAVVRAIERGEITVDDAIWRWALLPDELEQWREGYRAEGRRGLRAGRKPRVAGRGRGRPPRRDPGNNDGGGGQESPPRRYKSSISQPTIVAK